MGFVVFTTGTIGFIFSYKLNIKKIGLMVIAILCLMFY